MLTAEQRIRYRQLIQMALGGPIQADLMYLLYEYEELRKEHFLLSQYISLHAAEQLFDGVAAHPPDLRSQHVQEFIAHSTCAIIRLPCPTCASLIDINWSPEFEVTDNVYEWVLQVGEPKIASECRFSTIGSH